jgi:alkylhydroperoxidase family enzyme
MTTLPLPDPTQATGRMREAFEQAARRNGQPLEGLSHIWRAMAYWPEWLEANVAHSAATFKGSRALPPLTRECLHIAVSASNNCRF